MTAAPSCWVRLVKTPRQSRRLAVEAETSKATHGRCPCQVDSKVLEPQPEMNAVLADMGSRRLSVQADNQCLILRPESEPIPAADSHGLTAYEGKPIIPPNHGAGNF